MEILIDSRINKINKESFFYTEQLKKLYSVLLIKLIQPKNKTKIKGTLITGKPDAGKSTAIKQFKTVYRANVDEAKESDLFIFDVPPRVHAKGVFHKLCERLKILDTPNNYKNYSTLHFVDKAANKIRDRYKGVFIDELQNLFLIPSESQQEILELFNRLINQARIPIFLVGVEGVKEILVNINSDPANLQGTFSSRFPEFKLQNYSDKNDEDFIRLLIAINSHLYLKYPKDWFQDENIRETILDYTDGLVGKIVELLKESAIMSIRKGLETINVEILKESARELEYSAKR